MQARELRGPSFTSVSGSFGVGQIGGPYGPVPQLLSNPSHLRLPYVRDDLPRALPVERVGRGLALALAGVIAAALLAAVSTQVPLVALVAGFVSAAAGHLLYRRGAGSAPRRGAAPLLGLLVLGVGVAWVGWIAGGAWVISNRVYAGPPQEWAGWWPLVTEVVQTAPSVLFVALGVVGLLPTVRAVVSR